MPHSALLALIFLAAPPPPPPPPPVHAQQPQAVRSTPGLVLATGGRTAQCDKLLFTPDGSQLFARGDDKVVHRFPLTDTGFSPSKLPSLRWPIFREQRGGIYAMAFSPDAGADSLAIGGYGTRTGAVLTLDQALARLRAARPSEELLFFKKVRGREVVKLTTSRQRPLWRFFAERQAKGGGGGRDWIVWRYRDYFYDTNSARADGHVGWQVNVGGAGKPDFFPLERYRGDGEKTGFHQPAKVWALFDVGAEAEKVIFPDVQPPDVKVEVVSSPTKDRDLVLKVLVRPRDRLAAQKLSRLSLWVNDSKYPLDLKPGEDGTASVEKLPVSRSRLRNGRNVITVQATNVSGGRGEDSHAVSYEGGSTTPTLFALCVGIDDYTHVKGYRFDDLRCSRNDAGEMAKVFEQHANSKLYRRAVVRLVPQEKATAAEILRQLKDLGAQAKPGDWFVVFLSGHGSAERLTADTIRPGSFFFTCVDTDRASADSHLTSRALYEALAAIGCAKLIILDCCHAGDVAYNPARDLSREGVTTLLLSCRGDQSALEPRKGRHGFFTQSLLDVIGSSALAKDRGRQTPMRAGEVGSAVLRRLPELLARHELDPDEQIPELLPPALSGDAVLCRP